MAATAQALADAGFVEAGDADGAAARLRAQRRACASCRTPRARAWTACCRRCCRRPRLRSEPMLALAPAAGAAAQHPAAQRSYLALLDEQPAALARLVDVVARSALLAERLAAHPLLLDELLDARVAGPLPGRDAAASPPARASLRRRRRRGRAAGAQRSAPGAELPHRAGRAATAASPRSDSARQLAWLADGVVAARAARWRCAKCSAAHGRDRRRALRGARLRQPRRRGTRLRFRPRPGVPVRRAAADAHSDGARAARRAALVRAPGAEDRRAARRGHRRRAPVRGRRAPAPGRRQGPAGVVAGQLRRLPARARLDLGAPGAGARALRRRRCRRCARDFERVRAQTLARARDAADAARGRRRDARGACAPNSIAAMRRALRPQAGRGRAGRPGVPAAVRWCCAHAPRHPALLVPRNTPALLAGACARPALLDAGDGRRAARWRTPRCSRRASTARSTGGRDGCRWTTRSTPRARPSAPRHGRRRLDFVEAAC